MQKNFVDQCSKIKCLSMSKKNDLVIDPYAGVGTTLIAALKNNRKAAGSEILKKLGF